MSTQSKSYPLHRLPISGLVLGQFDLDRIPNAPQPPQTPPQVGVNVQVQPDFSSFERPIYIVEQEDPSTLPASSASSAASSASQGSSEGNAAEATEGGSLIIHDDPSRQVYKGEPEKTRGNYAVFVKQQDKNGNIRYSVIPVKKSYLFTKEVALYQRPVADIETAMKEQKGHRHINRVAKFIEKKSNSSNIEREENDDWAKFPKMNRLVEGTGKEVYDATAPESQSTFILPDKGPEEVDYDDQVDDDDLDQDDSGEKDNDGNDQWDEDEEQEEVDDEQEGTDKALLKEISENASSSTQTTLPSLSAVAYVEDSTMTGPKISGIHGQIGAEGSSVSNSEVDNGEASQQSSTKKARKREKPEYEYVDVGVSGSHTGTTSKRAKLDLIVEWRTGLINFFKRNQGTVEEKKVNKYVKQLKKKYAEKTDPSVQEKTGSRIQEILNEISERKLGKDGKTVYYVLISRFK
eukprot:gb/GECG01005842.1/.p1 GENE.gb/GECG01005842.1/~~gb/GECG01005842.1/.p1  ORF type:complete len:463 (+),score=92.55 gb/GECG01005842.1/:1-1389(+)